MRPLKLVGAALAGLALVSPASAEPPAEPRVLENIPELGERGGEIRTLIRRAKDAKLFVVYGYSRLVGYNRDLELVPDILEDVEVEEGRRFTFHLREGHKWSDGEPFTAEDFRFFWEDVAQHPELRPTGPPIQMVVEGERPEFEVLDERTVRYTWSKPNPFFLPALAGAAPLEVALPAHYLKPYHEAYAEPKALAAKVEAADARDWAQLFGRHSDEYDASDPNLPTLQPWRLVTPPPAQRVVTERNPHFHRVDAAGTQLPYADRVVFQIVESSLIPVKTGGGETDLQARGLNFTDVTFLKQAEERSGMRTLLWKTASAAHITLYPNLNAADPVWREVFRDRRVRQALSLGIDREAISEFLYFGVADPANNSLLRESPLWTDDIGLAFTQHDPDRANALLDEAGLAKRNGEGIRRLPDGRPMEIIVETAGEDTEHADVLELVASHWRELGVKLLTKPSQREVLRNRIFAGDALMTIAKGIENGLPTAEMSPAAYAPTSQIDYQWPKWGQYYETKGEAGTPIDMAGPERLFELFDQWRLAAETEERRAIWNEMLQLWSEGVYTLGIVSGVRQPVAVKPDLVNVPEEAVYNWDPGAHFGIYHPDTFWWREQG